MTGQLEHTLTRAVRAAPPLTCRGKGLCVCLKIKVKYPSLYYFQTTLRFFLRVALGRGQGNIFTDLLDICGLGISLEFTASLAFSGSCPLWAFMFLLVCIRFLLWSQVNISWVHCREANNNIATDCVPALDPRVCMSSYL